MNSRYILEQVEESFGGIKLAKYNRTKEYSYPRFIYFQLCKDFTKESLGVVGMNIGRDHATVLHGRKRFLKLTKPFVKGKFKPYYEVYLRIKQTLTKIDIKDYEKIKKPTNVYEKELESKIKMKYELELIKILKKHQTDLRKQRADIAIKEELFKNQEIFIKMKSIEDIMTLPLNDIHEFDRLAKVFYKRKVHEKKFEKQY